MYMISNTHLSFFSHFKVPILSHCIKTTAADADATTVARRVLPVLAAFGSQTSQLRGYKHAQTQPSTITARAQSHIQQ